MENVKTETVFEAEVIKGFRERVLTLRKGTKFELSKEDIKSWNNRGYITRLCHGNGLEWACIGRDNLRVYEVTKTYKEL